MAVVPVQRAETKRQEISGTRAQHTQSTDRHAQTEWGELWRSNPAVDDVIREACLKSKQNCSLQIGSGPSAVLVRNEDP